MTYDDLIKHFGGESKAATAGGYDRQRVYAWRISGRITTDAQIAYEVITGGELRADLPQAFRDLQRNGKRPKQPSGGK